MAWVEVISLDRCRLGAGTFVACGERELAIFRLSDPDRVAVIDNRCPHAGGNLSGGQVSGGVVQCPWHQWEFDLDSGVCTHSDAAKVRRYETEVRQGTIWIDVDSLKAPRCMTTDCFSIVRACSSAVRAGDS